jgi:protein-S-isoprenylcysteine O-methyltransferase Ste14
MVRSTVTLINDLCSHPALRSVLLSLRYPLALAGVGLVVWRLDPTWFWAGFAVSLTGALAQVWCFASLQKNEQLCVQGPYTVVRNPMYLARFILILGGVMLLGIPWLLAVLAVVYYFYMYNRVRREEARLRARFGDAYQRYCAQVRRFLPRCRRYEGHTLWYFRWDLLKRNHGLWNLAAVLAFYAVAALRAYALTHSSVP